MVFIFYINILKPESVFVTEPKFSGILMANTWKWQKWTYILRKIPCNGLLFLPKWPLKMGSDVTRGGRGGRVSHPWKVGGKFGRKRERRKKGRGREKEEEMDKRSKEKKENGEEKKGNCKRGEGKLKMEGERYENVLVSFWITEICLGCTKMEISSGGKNWEMGNFLTSPAFDCTPHPVTSLKMGRGFMARATYPCPNQI